MSRNPATSASNSKTDISDSAVQNATGKTWDEWFGLLDEAGANQMSHKEIVAHLASHYDLSGWWQQSVAVTYEKARGLREKHEHAGGYAVSANKTINKSIDELFAAWEDEALREGWLSEPFTIRKATPSKSIRITWHDGTHVDVYFYAKGDAKGQVSIQHSKLPDRDAAESQKLFWREKLQALKESLE